MRKTDRFFVRATPQEKRAAEKLAEKHGVTISDLICGLIRRNAKRQKVWEQA